MKNGYVYVGYDQNGLFKIGMAENYMKRMKQIQNMNPNFLIMFVIDSEEPRVLEKALHERFVSKRMTGEWFSLTADDLQSMVYEFKGIDVPIEEMEKHWKQGKGQDLF